VLLEKKLSDQALVHVQRAVAIDPENEVAWYRLAQTEKALGHAAEQQKALTEYRRLHDRTNQQHEIEPVFSPREVTKQEVDPNAAQ
jgi:predicted Zn-dependent protease